MDIKFASRKLCKQMNESKTMVRAHGNERSKRLQIIMTLLRAAPNLGVLAPPYSTPHRCHELTGNLKGYLSLDLDHPYRLLFKPIHDPIPTKADGRLDWEQVTVIEIKGVKDTHG